MQIHIVKCRDGNFEAVGYGHMMNNQSACYGVAPTEEAAVEIAKRNHVTDEGIRDINGDLVLTVLGLKSGSKVIPVR
jgi:hypothetical protein